MQGFEAVLQMSTVVKQLIAEAGGCHGVKYTHCMEKLHTLLDSVANADEATAVDSQ